MLTSPATQPCPPPPSPSPRQHPIKGPTHLLTCPGSTQLSTEDGTTGTTGTRAKSPSAPTATQTVRGQTPTDQPQRQAAGITEH